MVSIVFVFLIQSQLHGCGIPDGKSTGPAAHPPGGGVALKEEERRGLGLVGKSVKLVSLGAGAVQSWMSPGYTDTSSSSGRQALMYCRAPLE